MTETPGALETPGYRELLDQVLDKWSVLVLEELCEGPCRFNELRRRVPASQKSLSATLRRLERNGIVDRRVLDARPVAVQYAITPLGKTLRDPIDAILRWCETNLPAVERARAVHDAVDDAVDD